MSSAYDSIFFATSLKSSKDIPCERHTFLKASPICIVPYAIIGYTPCSPKTSLDACTKGS